MFFSPSLTALVGFVEDHLGAAASLAAATDGDVATFRAAVSTSVGAGQPFVTGSLWRLSGSSPQLMTQVGGEPLVPVTAALLRQAAASKTARLVFDMSGVEFMDSSGIALLASAVQKVREVELRNPTPIARRLVELTGLAGILRITP
jgi:ABC-type transporter Mla MlaB component